MDYVQNAFYTASNWHKDNSYGSLTATSQGQTISSSHHIYLRTKRSHYDQLSLISKLPPVSASPSPASPAPHSQRPTPSALSGSSTALSPTYTLPFRYQSLAQAPRSISDTSSPATGAFKTCAAPTSRGGGKYGMAENASTDEMCYCTGASSSQRVHWKGSISAD